MITYYCNTCVFYYQEAELRKGSHCPECGGKVTSRVMLAGQIMGAVREGKVS